MNFFQRGAILLTALIGVACGQSPYDPAPKAMVGVTTELPATSAQAGYAQEVWESNQTFNSPGAGLPQLPYNVSTQVLFDLVNGTTVGTNTHIHLAASTTAYLTRGNATWNIKSGCWIEGGGMGLTTVQLSSLAGNPTPIMVITNATQNNPYTKVSDITFDGNATALAAGANNSINAVEMDGDYVVMERCEAINMFSDSATGKENFTFKVANWYQSSTTTGYTQPAVGVGILIPTTTTSIYTVGDTVRVQTAAGVPQGWYVLTSINAGVSITGTNQGFAASVVPTTVVATGAVIFNEHGVRNCLIKDCVERLHLGNYGSSFCMFSDYNKAQSGDIIGCKCFDRSPTVTPVNGFGGFTGNQERGRIINGYAENCSHFFYCEGPVANVQILGCVGRNLTCTAIRLNGQGGNLFSNIEIGECDFEINNSADPSGGSIKYAINFTAPTKGNLSNIRIHDTSIKLKSTGATTTYGLNLNCTTQLQISNVEVDSTLVNNFDATSSSNTFSLFDNVTTPDGSFITLTGNNGLPEVLIVRPSNVATQSGTIFLSFYAGAKLIYPNNAAQSATNRVKILVQPSLYDLAASTWTIDDNTKYIDVMGLGHRDDTIFLSSADAANISAASVDLRWKNFTLKTSSASASVYALKRTGGTSTTENMEEIVLTGAGTYNAIQTGGGALWGGKYKRVKFSNGGFFGQGQSELDGTAEDCEVGANGTSNCYFSGTAIVRRLDCAGQLNLYRNDGLLEYFRVYGVTSNQDAILEQNNGANGGIYRYGTGIANGTGTFLKNSGGARSTAIYFCNSNADLDNSITNLIQPGQQFNVKDATNITK